jgi:iron-sulfur cluster assembly protein
MVDVLSVNLPITFTESAFKELKNICEDLNTDYNDSKGLRIGIKGGGCAGFTYILGIDSSKDNDEIYDYMGLNVYIQKAHILYLFGMEIDWLDNLQNRGFIFNNPNAKETCGCGISFSS